MKKCTNSSQHNVCLEKTNENFLDLTTKQQKKPSFYPYKKKQR